MGNKQWTPNQLAAINSKPRKIIVSAGAGSGKTSVLTERIVYHLENGISINRLIVLTFTNAAAFEMKTRVIKSIKEKIEEGNEALKSELELIDSAQIQTFDSFASAFLKKYYYLIGVKKDFSILDNGMFRMYAYRYIDEVLNSYYLKNDNYFLKVIDSFSDKNDLQFRKLLFEFYQLLQNKIDIDGYLDSYIDTYFSLQTVNEFIDDYIAMIKEKISMIVGMDTSVFPSLMSDYLEKIQNDLREFQTKKDYEGLLPIVGYSIKNAPIIRKDYDEIEYKPQFDSVKSLFRSTLNEIKELLRYSSINELTDEYYSAKNQMELLIEILKQVQQKMSVFLQERNVFTFSDIQRMAIRILENHPEIQEYYKKNYYEVLVDEYQDTNDVGDLMLSYITSNNIYMVGDIKQSIYRFRNANPAIFKEKYDTYQNENVGTVIELNNNFRSRADVIADINNIFDVAMPYEYTGIDYQKSHNLEYGNKQFDRYIDPNLPIHGYHMAVINYDTQNDQVKIDKIKDSELEIRTVALDILHKCENKAQVFDDKKGLRDCRFGDFTILVYSKTNFDYYKKVLEEYGIQTKIYKEISFMQSEEIIVVISILNLLNALKNNDYESKKMQKYCLSFLRSFLFDYTDEDIFRLLLEKGNSFIDNFKIYFKDLYEKINKLIEVVKNGSSSTLIDSIYQEFSIYSRLTKLHNVLERENKLNFLANKINELTKLQLNLQEIIEYFTYLGDEDKDIEFKFHDSSTDNAVKIMSIHNSKGLQFPFIYFLEFGKRFRFTGNHITKFGMILPTMKSFFVKKLEEYSERKEELCEKVRLLYVALTRAEERMIILRNGREDYHPNSFFYSINSLAGFIELYENLTLFFEESRVDYLNLNKTGRNKPIIENIDTKLTYIDYPKYQKILLSNKKASHETKELSDQLNFIIEKGKTIHKIFELVKFKNDLETEITRLGIEPKYQKYLRNFMGQDLFKNVIVNEFHELQFVYQEYNGIIDILFEFTDFYAIVDYKLSDIHKTEYIEQLKVYYDYVKQSVNKRVEVYLYSLNKNQMELIEYEE